ncbi:hypothetical protein H5410_045210 [Solanum commersonii]|uniref:KIB1-4 beta-propeller domain-containing protein n=1 Tax=Solanum commersonii TaxID=4109 RepID=A0A9J5XD14_SOLCO|nr:hypothetical protein H5410_045210 [Solanum commersonii]
MECDDLWSDAVCKRWRYAPMIPPPPPRHGLPEKWPCLMTLRGNTGIVKFFDPLYNVVTTTGIPIPKLRSSRIRSSKEEHENYFSSWTFSCPPNSSSSVCIVVGIDFDGCPPDAYIIKVGETSWTFSYLYDPDRYKCFKLTGCNNPIFFKNNIVYLGDKGNLGVLTINESSIPSWEFYGSYFRRRKQKSIQHVYTVEDVDNEGMLVVFLCHQEGEVEVWRYKMNRKVLEREQITSLDNNKTLFVSSGGSYLKICVAQGLGNKIFFQCFTTTIRVYSIVWPTANISLSITWTSKLIQVQIFLTWFNLDLAFGPNQ